MRRYIYSITIALLITVSGYAQSYGLSFNSHEVVQEKRTCLDLSPDDSLCFKTDFGLEFDIRFIPSREIYFGYVLRIIGNNSQNIDLIYNQPSSTFKVIVGESFSGISFTIDSIRLHKEWNHFSLQYDLADHRLQFGVNGRVIGKSTIPVTGTCYKFLWGANDYQKFKTRDIPPMRIKDIRITEGGSLKYMWRLDETSGDTCYDKVGRRLARVKNPVWLKPKYQQWNLVSSFTIRDYAGVAFDAKHDRIYVSGSDSLAVCSLKNEQQPLAWVASRHQDLLLGHQDIYDTLSDKLYDIFVDRKIVTAFDNDRHAWDITMPYAPITEFWHAGKFISVTDTALYMIGGYGQLKYKNTIQRYHFSTRKWDTVRAGGDYLPPRYLAALGMDPEGKYAYIVGGYGSQTGDQMLDPKNYYDLFRYDIKGNSFKRLYTLKTLSTPFTFANSLVIDRKPGTWYGLIFPNDSYNSNLQLVEGSQNDSSYRPVGNSIPYSFHDVQSFADLYYSPVSNKLIAVTLLYSKEEEKPRTTEVKIYSLDFPPEPLESALSATDEKRQKSYLYIFIAAGLIGLAVIVLINRRKGLAVPTKEDELQREPEPKPNTTQATQAVQTASATPVHAAIYLFGQFQVFDKEGHDITRLFTPLLKELFLVIITYSFRNGRGISSEGLNEILWHDKSEKDAKNNRSVNLAKLKAILEKTGNVVINKESAYWQIAIPDEDVYVDYKKYTSLLAVAADPAKAYIHPLVDIIKRGAFLSQTEYDWLDDIKSEISNSVIDLCLGYIKSQQVASDPEFIIEIANCIFCFDPLNEDALIYKCKCLILLKRHTLANNTYLKFTKEYKDIYGTDFGRSFQETIT